MSNQPSELKRVLRAVESYLRDKALNPEGIPPAEPWCPICRDARFILAKNSTTAVTFCECHYQRAALAIEASAPNPIRKSLEGKRITSQIAYRDYPPMTFAADMIIPSAKAVAYGFAVEDQKSMLERIRCDPLLGYAFYGPTGVGKSHMLWALAKECAYAGRITIFRTASQYCEGMRLSQTMEFIHHDGIDVDILGKKTSLFIDELDNIPTTEFSIRKLFELADACWRRLGDVRVSFASNLPSDELAIKIGDATFRRLNELTSGSFTMLSRS